jgi:hypothetical protein
MTAFKDFRRRFGISAPQMAVRIKPSWYWRAVEILIALSLLLALAAWGFALGREFANFAADDGGLSAPVADVAPRESGEANRLLQIERAARDHLARQVKLLSEENSRLKDDLLFFQTLMPAGSKEGVSINQLKLQRDAHSGDYRYRFFLVQAGNRQREFKGTVEVVVNLQDRDGPRTAVLSVSEGTESNRVSFKFYHRVEGSFRIPPGARVASLEVRVFENGDDTPRAIQSVGLS